MNSVISTRIINNVHEMKAIRSSWLELERNAQFKTAFNSFDWVSTWAEFYKEHIEKLLIFTSWDAEALVCVLPLYISKSNLKTACYIGSYEPTDIETCSEAQDFLMRSSAVDVSEPLSVIQSTMRKEGLNSIRLSNVSPNALILSAVESSDFPTTINLVRRRYLVDIPDGAEKLIRKTKRLRNAALRAGMRICQVTTEHDLERVFNALITLNRKRWISRGYKAIFDAHVFREFHRNIARKLLSTGSLSMLYLEQGSEVIGVNYGIRSNNTVIFYQSGFDEDKKPNVSPGKLLHSAQAQKAREQSLSHYDFMSSSLDETYKQSLASSSEPVYEVEIHAHKLTWVLAKFKVFARKIKRRLVF